MPNLLIYQAFGNLVAKEHRTAWKWLTRISNVNGTSIKNIRKDE